MAQPIQNPPVSVPPIALTTPPPQKLPPQYGFDPSTLQSRAPWEVDRSIQNLIREERLRSDSPEKQTMQDGCCSKRCFKPIKECCNVKCITKVALSCCACCLIVATCTPSAGSCIVKDVTN